MTFVCSKYKELTLFATIYFMVSFQKTVTQEMFQPPTSDQGPTIQCDNDVDDTINCTQNPTVQGM